MNNKWERRFIYRDEYYEKLPDPDDTAWITTQEQAELGEKQSVLNQEKRDQAASIRFWNILGRFMEND